MGRVLLTYIVKVPPHVKDHTRSILRIALSGSCSYADAYLARANLQKPPFSTAYKKVQDQSSL